MTNEIELTFEYVNHLKDSLNKLLATIGTVPIGRDDQLPFGWRKAAKGRTVWRLLEEIISQNLEKRAEEIGLNNFSPAISEVGVYDFSFSSSNYHNIYVNIKSSVINSRTNKDDISKARLLYDFMRERKNAILLIATIEIEFLENPMELKFTNCYVTPVNWLPDIYVNPSNNGNLQSSKYKNLDVAIPRSRIKFLELLSEQIEVADNKRNSKRR